MDYWVDPTDLDSIGVWFPEDVYPEGVIGSIAVASDILTRLSGYKVHPAGSTCEDFIGAVSVQRLTPTYRPITALTSVTRMNNCDEVGTDVTDAFCIFANSVWTKNRRPYGGGVISNARLCSEGGEMLSMCYDFGSTLTPAARQAAWHYASQIYLSVYPSQGECQLPERVTSVNREGVSWTVIDPQEYLDNGRTGLPGVDQYISAINPSQGKRTANVYIPEAPPGVVRL